VYAQDYFRKIGPAVAKRATISVNNDDRSARPKTLLKKELSKSRASGAMGH